MTRLVHIGDFHAAPGPRNADRYAALDAIIAAQAADDLDLGAWLWPGDLNHGRMTIEDRNALATRILRMATVAPVVILYGNHDLPGDLDIFAKLQANYPVVVVDRPRTIHLELATGEEAAVFCLPYPTKGGLVAMGIVPADVVDVAGEALDAIFAQAARELDAASSDGELALMIGHVNVGGSMTSSGQPNIGREIEISARQLDLLGPIYKGLNHIHKAQEIAGAHYAGSVCRLNWGEVEEKRYLTVDFTDEDTKVQSHPIDVAPMYHVEGALTREGFTYVNPVASWKGCEVRVRYTFPQSEHSVLEHAKVLAEFAEAKRLEIEPIAVPDRQLRAPEVAAARTLTDKLAAFAAIGGTTLAPSLIEKLAQLEHADPLSLLNLVQTAIARLTEEKATVAA